MLEGTGVQCLIKVISHGSLEEYIAVFCRLSGEASNLLNEDY